MYRKLDRRGRPEGRYRLAEPGIDVPSGFLDDLLAIDHNLYTIWHPYRVLWDSVINSYEGSLEDPRFTIQNLNGDLVFGFILTDGQGAPLFENKFHIWRYCSPHGWTHVCPVESTNGDYLQLLARRLHLQGRMNDKYGGRAYNRLLREGDEELIEKRRKDQLELQDAIYTENRKLLQTVADNYDRGITAPTNPKKDQIISYPGQSNRTKTERLLDDADFGGIIGPDGNPYETY